MRQYAIAASIEPGFSYSHFTNARLNLSGFLALDAIFLGLISIDEVEADVLTADVTARYGLTDRLQVDVNVPYLYRRSSFKSGGAGGPVRASATRAAMQAANRPPQRYNGRLFARAAGSRCGAAL